MKRLNSWACDDLGSDGVCGRLSAGAQICTGIAVPKRRQPASASGGDGTLEVPCSPDMTLGNVRTRCRCGQNRLIEGVAQPYLSRAWPDGVMPLGRQSLTGRRENECAR
jgi:hypothetical protein